jgi:hypothetical protein
LERRVDVVYLARLLTGATAAELRGRRVQRVRLQQAPAHRVDDLVVTAAADDGTDPLELSIAVRRAPKFRTSEEDTQKLFDNLVADLRRAMSAEIEKRLAICVAGPQPAARQVSQLAALVRHQTTPEGFYELVRTPQRFEKPVVDRLEHLVNLVTMSLEKAGEDASATAAELTTWQLLCRLDVLMPRLEPPDESDWADLLNQLEPWAREPTLVASAALRDRLESLAAKYGPAAADVDLAKLRRDAHAVLNVERRRRTVAWTELRRLDPEAHNAVRRTLGSDPGSKGVRLPRATPATAIRGALTPGPAVLISGESGVGKSALVLEELTDAAASEPGSIDVRSGSNGLPLSEADALDIVWARLIRNDERTTRGLPEARDQVMHRLAIQQLHQADATTTYASLDAAAVGGLRQAGLLRPPDRWQALPTFAHDLVRTYAVARALLSYDDPVAELVGQGAPRWALPAARLAVQVLFSAPDGPDSPLAGRLARVQADVDRLPTAGHGDRWADLPTEALLTLPNAQAILSDTWPTLVDGDAAGLRRLLRVVQQRHGQTGLIDRLIAEPVVALLLDRGWPSALGDEVNEVLRGWLRGLILAEQAAGHPLRIALGEQLVARVAAGDERLAEIRRERAERLAARTPDEVAADEERSRQMRAYATMSGRRRKPRPELPPELTDDALLEQLALLGPDMGAAGEALLRRVAAEAPQRLAPAVDDLFTGYGLAARSTPLLIELIEAYYIDDQVSDGYRRIGDKGIRRHHARGLLMQRSAAHLGPFLALFRSDLRAGVGCLNRLLNHAARVRMQALRRLSGTQVPEPEDRDVTELDITGQRRRYVGDGQVWLWYRGTGIGPDPCKSALQALELVCDEYLQAGAPLPPLVRLLLDGCESLAVPALVVGMLVRHLERVQNELDPFSRRAGRLGT